ncbi:hypothetical protein [Streptomyces sp. NRRL S-920]|nr:hypothetical protein [Streptomyces sp. NRRL S-920]
MHLVLGGLGGFGVGEGWALAVVLMVRVLADVVQVGGRDLVGVAG